MVPEIDLILYLASVFFLAVFSGASIALEILSLGRLEKQGAEDDNEFRFVGRLIDDPINSGISLSLASSIALAATVITAIRLGAGLFGSESLVITGLFVVISILAPAWFSKLVAVQGAGRFIGATRPVTILAAVLLRPIAALIARVIQRLSPALLSLISFEVIPLHQKLEVFSAQQGSEPDEEQRIMSSIVEFGETRVREVMVPRIDIVAVNLAMGRDEALEVIMGAGHSRIPLFEETVDHIVGVIYTKDLLHRIASGEDFSLSDVARSAFFVPESKMIDEMLTEFKRRKQHMAIVVDEYGGTAGIVTLEDVLEELVGDIQDEFDAEEELVEVIDDDTLICNAKTRVDELNEDFGLALPEDIAESLGGLIYDMLGHVPVVGDTCRIEPLELRVDSIERQRIDKVRVSGLIEMRRQARDTTG